MNGYGLYTLLAKETVRFRRILVQTVAAPALSALLYLVVFGHLLRARSEPTTGASYLAFMVPGLAMMALMQNAFANSSSSIMQSRMAGNLVFLLLSPLGPPEILVGYVVPAMLRGAIVAATVVALALPFTPLPVAHPLLALLFALLGGALLGALGLIAGMHARWFDELAAFQSLVIAPLSFLSGVFYTSRSLSPPFQIALRWNPFYYLVDGFRASFFGHADAPVALSLAVTALSAALAFAGALALLSRGYRIRN